MRLRLPQVHQIGERFASCLEGDGRLLALDFAKGVATLMVVVTHFWIQDATRARLLFPLWIDMAVPIFMIIMGIVNARSFDRRQADTLGDILTARYVLSRIAAYTIPFAIAFAATVLVGLPQLPDSLEYVWLFLQGGVGQGGYFYPVVLLSIPFVPMIYLLVKKRGLLLCFMINLAYEVLHVAYGLPTSTYRLLFFRYWFAVAVGCWLWKGRGIWSSRRSSSVVLLSLLFIVLTRYLGYVPAVLVDWTGTCLATVPWAAAVLSALLLTFSVLSTTSVGGALAAILARIGRSSYAIFWVQLVTYYALSSYGFQVVRGVGKLVQLLVILGWCVVVGMGVDRPVRSLCRGMTEALEGIANRAVALRR